MMEIWKPWEEEKKISEVLWRHGRKRDLGFKILISVVWGERDLGFRFHGCGWVKGI